MTGKCFQNPEVLLFSVTLSTWRKVMEHFYFWKSSILCKRNKIKFEKWFILKITVKIQIQLIVHRVFKGANIWQIKTIFYLADVSTYFLEFKKKSYSKWFVQVFKIWTSKWIGSSYLLTFMYQGFLCNLTCLVSVQHFRILDLLSFRFLTCLREELVFRNS